MGRLLAKEYCVSIAGWGAGNMSVYVVVVATAGVGGLIAGTTHMGVYPCDIAMALVPVSAAAVVAYGMTYVDTKFMGLLPYNGA
jgi:hypothetical protein